VIRRYIQKSEKENLVLFDPEKMKLGALQTQLAFDLKSVYISTLVRDASK
jgi:hypothetical protein